MNCTLVKSDRINNELYDGLISNDADANIYLSSWFLNVAADEWGAIVYNNYESVLPLSFRSKFGINYIYQPFFTRCTGIMGNKEKSPEINSFLDSLSQQYKYWDFSLEGDSSGLSNVVCTKRVYQHLKIGQPYENIFAGYTSGLKRNLRIAKENNLTVNNSRDTKLFTESFKKFTGSRINKFKTSDYNRMQTLIEKCMEKADTYFVSALKDDTEVASAIFCRNGSRIIYIQGYSSSAGRELKAMHLLFDYVIRNIAGTGDVLDFGGSNIASIAEFFKSFGGADHCYHHIERNELPVLFKWLKQLKS
jgi:hypothetical protein